MEFLKGLPVIGIILALVLIAYSSKSAGPEKKDQVPLKVTANTYSGIEYDDDKSEADVELTSPHGDKWALSVYDGSMLYEGKLQAAANQAAADRGEGKWTYKYIVHRRPIDFNIDLGAWAGFRSSGVAGRSGEAGFDIGLRLSPVRLGWGMLAPDFLLSPHQAGIGASLYAPTRTVSPFWQHIGIGLGYCVDFDGGSGWVPYAAISTRF